ncbi:MAG: hypothetical protein AAF533_04855 [Acidobacteriota bacterium]
MRHLRAALSISTLAVVVTAAHAGLPPRDWSTDFVSSVPLPYCQAGAGSGMTLVHDVSAPWLGLVSQTPGDDDIVWLDSIDGRNELGRCCAWRPSATLPVLQSMTVDEGVGCAGMPSFFVGGNGTYVDGRILEMPLFVGNSRSDSRCECGDTGDDELACSSMDYCSSIRRFGFAGMPGDDGADGLAVLRPDPRGPAILAVAVLRQIFFVDPSSPSCAAETVDVLGQCSNLDNLDGDRILIGGLAWAGGHELLASDHNRQLVYRLDVEDYACTVIEQVAIPGPTRAIAFDRDRRQLHVLDTANSVIHSTAEYTSMVPDPNAVGNALRVRRLGSSLDDPVEIELDWTLDAGAPRPGDVGYEVLRGVDPASLEPMTETTGMRDPILPEMLDAPPTGASLVCYRVRAVDDCGRMSDEGDPGGK